jgi:hypothetical protein
MDLARPSAKHYETRGRWQAALAWLSASVLACLIALKVPRDIAITALLAWVVGSWTIALARPRLGLYLLLVGTMFVEQNDPPGGPFLFNAQIPFFWDSAGFTPLRLPVSPAEFLLGATIVGWLIHGVRSRKDLWLRSHALAVPTLLFAATLVLGAIHGLATGGDLKAALWEIRGPSYTVAMIVLVPALVERRCHLDRLVGIIVVGVLWVAVEGLWISGVDLEWHVTRVDTIVGHDDALHIASALVLLVAMLAVGGRRWQKLALLAGAPMLLGVLFATRRRDAFVALALGVLVVAVLRARERPRFALQFLAVAIAAVAIYGVLYLTLGTHATVAQPIRAITSAVAPSTERDIASNAYRHFERVGLWRTIRSSPIIGVGFGQPYDVPPQVFDIGVPLYQYITHDDLLRFWAKTGTIGFLVYCFFVGSTVVYGMTAYQRLRAGELKALAMFSVSFVMMLLTVHSVDMAMTSYRTMILLGVAIGGLVTLERVERDEAHA